MIALLLGICDRLFNGWTIWNILKCQLNERLSKHMHRHCLRTVLPSAGWLWVRLAETFVCHKWSARCILLGDAIAICHFLCIHLYSERAVDVHVSRPRSAITISNLTHLRARSLSFASVLFLPYSWLRFNTFTCFYLFMAVSAFANAILWPQWWWWWSVVERKKNVWIE